MLETKAVASSCIKLVAVLVSSRPMKRSVSIKPSFSYFWRGLGLSRAGMVATRVSWSERE